MAGSSRAAVASAPFAGFQHGTCRLRQPLIRCTGYGEHCFGRRVCKIRSGLPDDKSAVSPGVRKPYVPKKLPVAGEIR